MWPDSSNRYDLHLSVVPGRDSNSCACRHRLLLYSNDLRQLLCGSDQYLDKLLLYISTNDCDRRRSAFIGYHAFRRADTLLQC